MTTGRPRCRAPVAPEAAREIDQTAKAMFLDSFGKVRENFRTVFQTLFGGGECDVRLANEDEPLESEIESSAPRGKRRSGSTSCRPGNDARRVSLLFAISSQADPSAARRSGRPLDDATWAATCELLAEFKT